MADAQGLTNTYNATTRLNMTTPDPKQEQSIMTLDGVDYYTPDKICPCCGSTKMQIGALTSGPNGLKMSAPTCADCGAEKPVMSRPKEA